MHDFNEHHASTLPGKIMYDTSLCQADPTLAKAIINALAQVIILCDSDFAVTVGPGCLKISKVKYDSCSQKNTSVVLMAAYQFVADFVAQTLHSEFPDLCEKIGAKGMQCLFPGSKLKCLNFDGESDPYT